MEIMLLHNILNLFNALLFCEYLVVIKLSQYVVFLHVYSSYVKDVSDFLININAIQKYKCNKYMKT